MKDKPVQQFYSKRDFVPYVFQLVLVAAAVHVTFSALWIRALVDVSLVYLAVTFVLRRGATLDAGAAWMIVRGVFGYPRYLAQLMWIGRRDVLLNAGIFSAAVLVETTCIRRGIITSSFWTGALPFMHLVGALLAITWAFRTFVFVVHLRKMPAILDILQTSGWRHQLRQSPLWNHLLHGYVTGNITTLCLMIPFVAFWQLTGPTYLREGLLLALGIGVHLTDTLLVRRRLRVPFVHAMQRQSIPPVFYAAHEKQHASRFYFTVFHGPHHDAIPSSVMAAAEAGFLEAMDRGVHYGLFFKGCVDVCFTHGVYIFLAMMAHQYIPGCFPYSKSVARQANHHVVHHFGSARPFSLGIDPCLDVDVQHGYKRDNAILRWFVKTVQAHEHIDAAAMYGSAVKREFTAIGEQHES